MRHGLKRDGLTGSPIITAPSSGAISTVTGRACRLGFDRIIDTDLPIRGTLDMTTQPTEGRGAYQDGSACEDGGAGEDGSTSIRICWHPPIGAQPGDRPIWLLTGDALRFAAPGVADYRCTPTMIDVTPTVGARDAMIEALLIATALPAVLWLQGDFMLHASAIVPHDRLDNAALAIAGASGCGKSRLAAAFLAKGADLVADDSIAVRMVDQDQGSPRCAGLAGGYHLAGQGERTGQGGQGERAFHPVADGHTRRVARLAAVVVLQDGPRACRTRLGVIDAIEALLANRHRPSVPRRCGLEPRALDDAALLARTVPVYRWPREEADALLDDDIRRTIMRNGGE
jgi:hypothetical protein